MKVKVHKEFRPYSISIESSRDHQDLLRALSDAMAKYHSNTIGYQDLKRFQEELFKTQKGGEE